MVTTRDQKIKFFQYYALIAALLAVSCDITEPNPPKGLEVVRTYKDGNAYYALIKYTDLLFTLSGHQDDDEPNLVRLFPHLEVFDISQPSNPVCLSTTQLDSVAYGFTPSWGYLEYAHPYLYIEDYPRIKIFDLSDPSEPLKLEPFLVPSEYRYDSFHRMRIKGEYLFVCGSLGLMILDISEGGHPRFAGAWTDVAVVDIEFQGDYAYVSGEGLTILNVADPINPALVGRCQAPGDAHGDVTLYQNYAFMGYGFQEANEYRYHVINIQDKSNPQLTYLKLPTPQFTSSDFAVEEDFLYVGGYKSGALTGAHSEDGVYVIDLKDMGVEKWHGFWPVPNTSRGVYPDQAVDLVVEGRTVYVAHQHSGFSVLRNTL